MKVLLLLLISSVTFAGPLERNEYTKKMSFALEDRINTKFRKLSSDVSRFEEGFIVYVSEHDNALGEPCQVNYYVDPRGYIRDIRLDGENCFNEDYFPF